MNAATEAEYYPTDREILAAKVSEIMAESVRVSEKLPKGHELFASYQSRSEIFYLSCYVDGKNTALFVVDINQPDASRDLDGALELVSKLGGAA